MTNYLNKMIDRRLANRYSVKLPIRCRFGRSAVSEYATESLNVSELGILFITKERISIGEAVDVLVQMPRPLDGPAILCMGHVVRVDPDFINGMWDAGVQFDCFGDAKRPAVCKNCRKTFRTIFENIAFTPRADFDGPEIN